MGRLWGGEEIEEKGLDVSTVHRAKVHQGEWWRESELKGIIPCIRNGVSRALPQTTEADIRSVSTHDHMQWTRFQ